MARRQLHAVGSHMARGLFDVPLVIAGLLLLFAKWDAGVTAVHGWSVWWLLFWLAPLFYFAAWALFGVRRDLRALLLCLCLPPIAFAGLGFLERGLGRTSSLPWWLTHVLICIALVGIALWVTSEMELWRLRIKMVALVTATLVLPMVPFSTAQGLWKDCWRLRIGSDTASTFDVLRNQYVLDPGSQRGEDRYRIRDLAASGWTGYEELTVGSADFNADVAFLSFSSGKLISYWLSPD